MNDEINNRISGHTGKPIPIRCCISCREQFNREILIRVVHDRLTNHIFIIQPGENKIVSSGRSVYICFTQGCIEKAIKAKKLQKTLKTSLPDDIVNCLLQLLKGNQTRVTNKG